MENTVFFPPSGKNLPTLDVIGPGLNFTVEEIVASKIWVLYRMLLQVTED